MILPPPDNQSREMWNRCCNWVYSAWICKRVISSFHYSFVSVGLARDCGNRQYYRIGTVSPRHRCDQHTLWSVATWTHEDVPDLVNGLDRILGHPVDDDIAAARDAATTFVGVMMKDAKEIDGDEMGEVVVGEIHDHLH